VETFETSSVLGVLEFFLKKYKHKDGGTLNNAFNGLYIKYHFSKLILDYSWQPVTMQAERHTPRVLKLMGQHAY